MDVLMVSLLTAATDAPTEDMVATVMDAAMEATGFLTVAMDVLTEDMEATDVATMARGRLRLRPRLLTDTAMAAAMEATAAPTEDMVATGPMAAMAALTGMATESRQQPEHQNHMNNLKLLHMNLTKYKFK